MKPVLCIAGPTASGKSAYAVRLAKAVGGEIVNADALQVYGDLQILSARPTEEEMQDVPHHLFGHVTGAVRYSTGAWLREVEPIIVECLARDVVPIIVGGTGLYFRALLMGLADIPLVPDDVRAKTQAILEVKGIAAVRELAMALDPVATSRVLGNDPQRLLRIVDVATGTQKPLSVWQDQTHPIVPSRFARYCVLTPPRETLYGRIDARYESMMRGGGLEEAERVFELGLDETLPMMKAIGLRQLRSYFKGLSSLDEAVEDAKRESRRFAKRQMTWFRNQPPKGELLLTDAERERYLRSVTGLSF